MKNKVKKVKIEIIKERLNAGFKVGMIVEVTENRAVLYIQRGIAKKVEENKDAEKESLKAESKEKELPKMETKEEVKTPPKKKTTSKSQTKKSEK